MKIPRATYIKAWSWPEDVEQFIKSKIKGYTLHACCGDSEIGDIKIDIKPQRDDVICKDVYELDYKEEFDTIVCDPPWKIPIHLRPKFLYPLRDALKPNGIIIFNSPWPPKVKGIQIEELYFRLSDWRNVRMIFIGRKIQSQFNDKVWKYKF